jgi:hypothetical protein
MMKEAVVAYFEILTRRLPGGTEEVTKSFSQDSRCPRRDSIQSRIEYKSQA